MTGIIFDLDGTLLDTLDDLTTGVNFALGQLLYPLRTREEVRRFVGNGAERLIRLSVPAGGDAERALAIFRQYYAAHCRVKTAPYPGIIESLRQIAEEFPVAIVSNKPDDAVRRLCGDYFSGIPCFGERQGICRKPAADMVLLAMREIGSDRCVYVGDSEVDVATAVNAAAECLSVLWGFRDEAELLAAGAGHFCSTPENLPHDVLALVSGEKMKGTIAYGK